jgi:peptide/nickel transport system substrate-binding protein
MNGPSNTRGNMMVTRRRGLAMLLGAAAGSRLAAAWRGVRPGASGGTTVSAQSAGVLNVGLYSEPDYIDPHVSTSVGFVPIDNAYEALATTYRDTAKIVPQLASSWTSSPDGRLWTFTIRRGVKFSDGADLDANAVLASFDRIRRLNKGPVWALSQLDGAVAKDPYTVVMQIRPGGAPFLPALATIRIVSPKVIRDHDADLAQDFLNRQSAGTGPYRITQWQHSQKVVLTKFDGYWGGWKSPGHFSTVNMLIIPEADTQLLMLEKGDLDIAMNYPAQSLSDLARNPAIQIVRAPGLRVLYLRLQNAAPPTNDPRVRQALNYAFDAVSFQKAVDGTYDPPVGPVPAEFLGGWTPRFPYHYDVAKARTLLQEAGYSESRRARLVADILVDDGGQEQAAVILQAGLRATRLADLDIHEDEWPVMLKYATDWQQHRDPATAHHLFGLYTPPRVADAYAYLWYTYDSKAIGAFARNIMNYRNPKVDELIEHGALESDPRRRIAIYRQAAQAIVDDAADLFVGTQQKIYVLRKDLRGFYPHPLWFPTVTAYALSR